MNSKLKKVAQYCTEGSISSRENPKESDRKDLNRRLKGFSSSRRKSEVPGKSVTISSLLKISNLNPRRRYMKEQAIVLGAYWEVWMSMAEQSMSCISSRKMR